LSGTAEPVHAVDQTDPIIDWARAHGLKQLVTAYVPVGPTAGAMRELSDRLADHGIVLVRALRKWDHAAWPHATRGFFPFKKRIPALLEQAGLS